MPFLGDQKRNYHMAIINRYVYEFYIHKSDEVSDEEFMMAVDCARTSVESVLYDFNAKISIDGRKMVVAVDGITEMECKDKIRGCFRTASNDLYPEFIEPA